MAGATFLTAAALIAVPAFAHADPLEARAIAWCDEFQNLGGAFHYMDPKGHPGVVWFSKPMLGESPRVHELWNESSRGPLRLAVVHEAKRRLGML